ncbi:hypothetical protein Scep_006467 [Stephania cephalantha]|uniref:Uncharacterized protein n=1 Tax=Stephania cephalantha TaxID=152367 RepID=A0AAP0K989_9MAGN
MPSADVAPPLLSSSATPPRVSSSVTRPLVSSSATPPPLLIRDFAGARLIRDSATSLLPLHTPLAHRTAVGPSFTPVFFTWDLQMSFAIYDAWCRKAAIRHTCNIYLIAKKTITPIYLTYEVFEHYKRKRATYEAFKKKSEQMCTNRKSEVGGPGTGISLHSAGSIFARQHGDTLEKKLKCRPTRKEMFRHLHNHGHDGQTFVDQRSAKIDAELTRRLEEMSTQSPDTSIDDDAVYLEVVPEVKGRVYGLGSQGYHCSISSGEASSSRGPAYGPHELEELHRDHQRLQETLLKERMERQ